MMALLDESLNNSFSWDRLKPGFVVTEDGELKRSATAIPSGPGAFVTDADPEPAWNAWYGAPGFDADRRHIPDQYVDYGRLVPQVGVNPWDHVFGPITADDGIRAVAARRLVDQSGAYSMS